MSEDEDYKDIAQLKAEIKSNQVSIKQLYDSIGNLSKLLEDMFAMFKNASEQMKLEENMTEERKKAHEEILKKLNEIIEQNKTIATGMVDVSDIVKEKLGDVGKPISPQMPPPLWQPRPSEPMPRPMGMMPPPMGAPAMPQMNSQNMPPMGKPKMPPPGMAGPMPNMMSPPSDLPPLDFEGLDEIPLDEPKKKKGFHLFGKK